MSKILVITTLPDPHVDLVQRHLQDDLIVFDPKAFFKTSGISYKVSNGTVRIIFNGWDFSEVQSVWFRKPEYLSKKDFDVPSEYQGFAKDSYLKALLTLYDLLSDRLWISNYRNIMRANNKVWQLEQAYKLGFNVPDTLVTSIAHEVESFRQKWQTIITKSLTFSPIQMDEISYGFLTTRIGINDSLDLSGLHLAPAIFQQEICNKKDIRVTVVGDEVFPCEISLDNSIANEVDWRIGIRTGSLKYTPFTGLRDDLKRQCINCIRSMGLNYGAIDFAIDQNGTFWFLEINPNGQWAFVELNSGLEISKSIANILSL